ncbi:acyltransferase family protein [Cupriavidus pauculus]|nr:acyltransferase family protein [Cupriavidus pauculus]
MVVLLHISALNIHEFGSKWWAANFWDSLSRACVPLFFMLSGATLLPKAEAISVFLRKRAARILAPLLLWSIFYLWWLDINGVDTGNWLVAIVRGPTMYHLWYFYAVIGLYMFVPVIRKFYQGATDVERLYFLGVWFMVSSVYPAVQAIYGMSIDRQCGYMQLGMLADVYHLQSFSGYIGYMILGAYLMERRPNARLGFSVFAGSSILTMFATFALSKWLGTPCEFFFTYFQPLVVVAAASLYWALLGLAPGKSSSALRYVSDCTLGVYGLHAFMIDPVFMRLGLFQVTGVPWVDPLIGAVGVFATCLAIIGLLRWPTPMRHIVG